MTRGGPAWEAAGRFAADGSVGMDFTPPPFGPGIVRPGIETLEDSPIVEIWRLGRDRPDVIPLWVGEPDVPTPDFIAEAAIRALRDGDTFYTPNRGTPALRTALGDYLERLYGVRVTDRRLAVTSAGMSAVMLVGQALIEPGGNAVVVTPCWPNITRAMQVLGAGIREVALRGGAAGWQLDLDALFAACDRRTRLIYCASPGNPTGWVLDAAAAARLLDFARGRGIAILADEVYHRLAYDRAERAAAPSLLEIAGPADPVYVVNSFSKAWAMTGWRLGWLVYPDGQELVFEKLIQFNTSGAPGFLQAGGAAALREGEAFVAAFRARCQAGRDRIEAGLAAIPRVLVVPSQGAFYSMFAVDGVEDTMRFCREAVLQAGLGLAPGTAFGSGAKRHLRLCYAKSEALLDEALDRLAKFVARYPGT